MNIAIVGRARDVIEIIREVQSLPPHNHEIVVLTDDPRDAEVITREFDVAVFSGDLFDENLYLEARLRSVDVVIAVHENEMINVFVAMLAKEYNVPKIIVVANNETVIRMLSKEITKYVVGRSSGISEKVKELLLGFKVYDFGENVLAVGRVSEELRELSRRSVKELSEMGVSILFIIRNGRPIDITTDATINIDDFIAILGPKETVYKLLIRK
ncbi:MAG: TrkA family potassium uptake protein [Ignisphaera sp.]|nr:TrkA family potassium uptake protein [Ignisphaera sp.]